MHTGKGFLSVVAVVIGLVVSFAAGCGTSTPAEQPGITADVSGDARTCMPGADCDDGDPCTRNDQCDDNNVCAGEAYSCDNDKECTKAACLGNGECEYEITAGYCLISGVCHADGDLHPKNGCRECITSVSKTEWSNDDTNQCEDGDACMQSDYCDSGECISGVEPLECEDDNPCTEDTCEPDTGCQFAAVDGDCDDGDACTENDSCKEGTCAGDAVDCDDDNDCTQDSCVTETGCLNEPTTDFCDDGNACTQDDACSESECIGTPLECDDDDVCNGLETCDSVDGCLDGEPLVCDNADVCDGLETCDPVEGCVSGTPLVCNDGNPCTDDSCEPDVGCINAANNVVCDDQDACTVTDTCSDSVCVGQPLDCNDGNPCTNDLCDTAQGCGYENIAGNCDDGSVCTVGDFCQSGACQPGTTLVQCDDSNVCTADSCDPLNGCQHAAKNGACNDQDTCTVGDFCADSACQPGPTPLKCDDNNLCTTDTCDQQTGCLNEFNTEPCDDDNVCTIGDACFDGACQPGAQNKDCDDDDVCTDDACHPLNGCQHAFNTAPCSDTNECTENDACNQGQCEGDIKICNDDNLCTTDTCNPANPGGCVFTPNNKQCNDGDPCTLGDVCVDGECAAGGGTLSCNDNNECTKDTCVAGVGCKFANMPYQCEDGNPCTTGDYCANGQCLSGPNECGCQVNADCAAQEDGNKCNGTLYCDKGQLPYTCEVAPATIVLCNPALNTQCSVQECVPATGNCTAKPTNEGVECDDDDLCTEYDICVAGDCVGDDIPACGMGQPCAVDDDCLAGHACLDTMPGGYCVQANCDVQGCPAGSSCWGFNGGALFLCLKDCLSDNDCRTDDYYICDADDTCWCGEQICEPAEPACNGDVATFCDPCGAGFLDGGTNCAALGEHCVKGKCQPLLCGSLSFDGKDDFVTIPNIDLGGTFTIEFWVRASSLSPTENTYVFSQWAANCGTYDCLLFGFWKWIGIWWHNEAFATETKVDGTQLSIVDEWVHFAATFDSQTMTRKLWIGGQLKKSTQAPSPLLSSQATATYIGRLNENMGAYKPYHGLIGWFKVSDVIRYSHTFVPTIEHLPDPNTVALYLFQELNGDSLLDSSGNGNHGIIHGAVWNEDAPFCIDGGVCGDGIKASWEQCDDGNNVDGDGCSSSCKNTAHAVKLTNKTARISIANTGFGVGSGAWTFEFWIKLHSEFSEGAKYVFVMNESYATYGIRAHLTEDGGNTVVSFTNYIGGAGGVNGNSAPIGDGAWHHVAWVFDGASATIFTDGISGQKSTGSGVLKAQSSMSLGRPSGYGGYLAAPVYVGPTRFSSTARYVAGFVPEFKWQVDVDTVGQWLVAQSFDGTNLVDEAGEDNNGVHEQGVIPALMP